MSCSRREFSSSGLGLASSIVGNTSHIMSTLYNYNTNKTIILNMIFIVSDIQFISDIPKCTHIKILTVVILKESFLL